ncbi:hypothetical protein I3842_11G017700 [Carya illinoinensis]|uniref:Cytochrome P450 n=1 Tax=Carya illinoinensis TaxID=32201 RepID=A0A922DKY4_CARIL|nr:hypothetical protein I3842_11G017700 [Carya illinoinensis]
MALPLSFMQSWQELQKLPVNPLLSILLIIFSLLYVFRRIFRSGKANLPPSPPKLPLIGNLHQLGTLPHRSFQALSKKYGPVMLLQLGHAPTLVVSSPDMAREIMKTHDIVFSNRPRTTAANILLYGCTDIGFAPYGEYWRQAKKICVAELLSPKRVQSFQYVREEEVALLRNMLRVSCLRQTSVNLSEMFVATSINIISRCTLGQKFEGGDGKSKFGQLSRRLMVLLTTFCVGDFFPSLGWIDVLTGLIPNLKSTLKEIDDVLDLLVEEHQTITGDNYQKSNKKDFVDILQQLREDGSLEFELTLDNLKAILLDMFVGGSDTTSTILEWLMAELIKNPNIMKRAQEEVRRVVGNKLKIDENDINQMDYLKCIIKETFRLHAPLPFLVPRETSARVKFGNYDIPEKTKVFVNTWAIQRDPTVWERPEEFLPERFIDNAIDFKGQDFEFLPFGGGRRGCPGLTFGVAAIEYVIANILCWFDWRLSGANLSGKELDMGEVYGLTVSKKVPLHLVPTLHSPPSVH